MGIISLVKRKFKAYRERQTKLKAERNAFEQISQRKARAAYYKEVERQKIIQARQAARERFSKPKAQGLRFNADNLLRGVGESFGVPRGMR